MSIVSLLHAKVPYSDSVSCAAGRMGPKKDEKEESEYTYESEADAEDEGEPEPAPPQLRLRGHIGGPMRRPAT